MALSEKQGLSGILTIEVRTPEGRLVQRQRQDNLITAAGKSLVAKLFTGEVAGKPQLSIAVGDGGDAAQAGDIKLKNQLDQVSAGAKVDKDRSAATVSATFPGLGEGKSQVLREGGILITFPNQEPVLYNRVTFADITRTGSLEMTLSWEVLF